MSGYSRTLPMMGTQSPIPNPQSLFVRQHPRQLGRVDFRNCRRSAQAALAFARLAAQDVLLERAAAEKLAVLRPLEPLRGPAVRLDLQLFRHACPYVVVVVVTCLAGAALALPPPLCGRRVRMVCI